MKTKPILKSIFSLCFVLFFAQAKAQTVPTNPTTQGKNGVTTAASPVKKEAMSEKKGKTTPTDSLATYKTNRYGLRVGLDLFKLSRRFYDKNYQGIELVGDYRFTKNYYLAAELGNENKTTDDVRLNSTAKGSYLKVGFDYNAYENWLDMENILSVGMRYGFATFSQQLNTYKIYNVNSYFGENLPLISGENYSGLTASWVEVTAGIKAKMFNNVFVGFGFQLKKLITNSQPPNFENLYIPGFNRTYGGTIGVGFNYTISYFIPIYKKKLKIEATTNKEKNSL